MSVITYPLNGIDYDAENAETYLCTRVSGVYASDGHFDATVTDTRVVTIGTGLAWIRNTDHSGKSVYNDAATAITIPMADGAMDRIDRIVLRFSKAENLSRIMVKEGTPSAEPEPPEITQNESVYELGLYTVSVPAASVTVSSSNITDTRIDEEVCGLMRDGVTGIPTAQIQVQVEELMESLKAEIAAIEAGSEVMLKATYDPAGGERQVAFENELTDGSVTKIGTGTVGSTTRPIYLDGGTPTALSGTVGSTTRPIYLDGGTLTAGNAFSTEIVYNMVSIDNQTVPASSHLDIILNVSYSGYTLLGVVGYNLADASSSGTHSSLCFITKLYRYNATTIQIRLHNTYSSDAKIRVDVHCLYLKNS